MAQTELPQGSSTPLYGGKHMPPDDLREAMSFQSSHFQEEIRAFRKSQLGSLRSSSEELPAEWVAIRAGLSKEGLRSHAKVHTSFVATPLDGHEMGARQRVKRLEQGLPRTGRLADPGVCPTQEGAPPPSSSRRVPRKSEVSEKEKKSRWSMMVRSGGRHRAQLGRGSRDHPFLYDPE